MSATAALAILRQHQDVIQQLDRLIPDILAFAARLITCLDGGGTVLWIGNGGSAGDAQHLSAELIGRFKRERRGLRSLKAASDLIIAVPSQVTARIQEAHILIGHLVCELVDDHFADRIPTGA